MPDKLPPIYLHAGTAEYLATAPKTAHLSVNCSMSPSAHAVTEYGPAAPKCRTCGRNGLGTCFLLGTLISDDDYCSQHTETKP